MQGAIKVISGPLFKERHARFTTVGPLNPYLRNNEENLCSSSKINKFLVPAAFSHILE